MSVSEEKNNETTSDEWFEEDIAPNLQLKTKLKPGPRLATKSEFQKVEVIETEAFGKTLILDGLTQSAKFDEFCYHESLVHPALFRATILSEDKVPPKSVFIGGGGELATAREILKHKSIERVVMVDIDGVVVDICRKHLPEWGGDAIVSDPRFELVIGDAHKWLMETEETFDVVIMDISDPVEAGPGIILYTKEFYTHIVTRLRKPNGVFVTQSGTAHSVPIMAGSSNEDSACIGPIRNTLASVFDCVIPFATHIPSFGGDWGFVMAFNAPEGRSSEDLVKTTRIPEDGIIDSLISEQIEGGEQSMKFYDGISHVRIFHLTKPLRKSLEGDDRIMTKDNPVFMFSVAAPSS